MKDVGARKAIAYRHEFYTSMMGIQNWDSQVNWVPAQDTLH